MAGGSIGLSERSRSDLSRVSTALESGIALKS